MNKILKAQGTSQLYHGASRVVCVRACDGVCVSSLS